MVAVATKHRPAPLLVCTYSFGEGELPTVHAARDADHAQALAQAEAAAACRPTVRVYSVDDDGQCALAWSVTL